MKHLLLPAHIDALSGLAWSNTLLAFDFDGTLSPIVADRDAAGMRTRTRALFTTACHLFPTAVISGRSRQDVSSKLIGCGVKYVVGNHGLEPGTNLRKAKRSLDAARVCLAEFARSMAGIDVEDKEYSLSVHYRRTRNHRSANMAIRRVIKTMAMPMRVVGGKCVVNVMPADAPTKGDALLALRAKSKADTALYVGDDVTDEDVFQIDEPGRLLSVRVGRSSTSSAPYYLKAQREVDTLLSRLITFRSRITP